MIFRAQALEVCRWPIALEQKLRHFEFGAFRQLATSSALTVHWIHVRFAMVIGYDEIVMPRVTLCYSNTIWQQKDWLGPPSQLSEKELV